MTTENTRKKLPSPKRQSRKRSGGSKRSKRSSAYSKSHSRSPSVGAKPKAAQAFMCSRCVRPKSYLIPKQEDKPKKVKKERLDPSEICPIHGHIELEFDSSETQQT